MNPARLLPPVLALLSAGCQELRVEPFHGSWISLTITWPLLQATPMGPAPLPIPDGEHLELWAQLDSGLVRLAADERAPEQFPGFDARPALSPNDPCLIRALNPDDEECAGVVSARCGAHLLSADAQPSADGATRELQRQALVQHVRQVVSQSTMISVAGVSGKAPTSLLVLTQHDPRGRAEAPALTLTAANAGEGAEAPERARRCLDFAAAHPGYYLGNPRQLTKRLHGNLYGFFSFSTSPAAQPDLPQQNFGGIVVTTLTSLKDLKGLLVTREVDGQMPAAPSADPARRFVTGAVLPASAGGRGVIRLALVAALPLGPMGAPVQTTVGTASVLTGLDQGIEE